MYPGNSACKIWSSHCVRRMSNTRRKARREQRPQRTQAQGDAAQAGGTAGITGMPHDGVGASVDDPLATIRLDADGGLEELVHGFGPGDDPHAGQEQDIADAASPPGHRKPVKPPVVQRRHRENGQHRRDDEADQDSIPGFVPRWGLIRAATVRGSPARCTRPPPPPSPATRPGTATPSARPRFRPAGTGTGRRTAASPSRYKTRRRRLIRSGLWSVSSAAVMVHSSRRLTASRRFFAGSPSSLHPAFVRACHRDHFTRGAERRKMTIGRTRSLPSSENADAPARVQLEEGSPPVRQAGAGGFLGLVVCAVPGHEPGRG